MSGTVPLASSASLASGASLAQRGGTLARLAVAAATVIVILGLAVVGVAEPLYLGSALERAGSARILGIGPAEARAISESVVLELLVGPGTFAQTFTDAEGVTRAFFEPAEASHLRDVRTLVLLLAAVVLVGAGTLVVAGWRGRRQAWFWRAVARGAGSLAVALVAIGLLFAVFFDAAFTAFHLVFFLGGNWSFDPSIARMVQLYPTPFWQELTVVLAVVVATLAALTWLAARRRARALAERAA